MPKKSQLEGTSAAVLVAIIAGLIILYLLFLPSKEREDMLGEGESEEGESEEDGNMTLLSVSPGHLDFAALDEYEHNIPSFTLFKTTNAEEIAKINPFTVRNGVFDKKPAVIEFRVDDLENAENIYLTFLSKIHRGVLTITLNGNMVYEYAITSLNVEPIELKKDYLKASNMLEFSVSPVGYKFWTTNEYSFENVKIVGDITDVSRQESRNVFFVTSAEADNLDKAKLKFNPDCAPSDVGVLDISINSRNILSAVPDCGILNTVEFSPGILNSGENKVVFKTNKGSYIIDQIKVKTNLVEKIFPVYYFDINESQYNNVTAGNNDVLLRIEFVDSEDEYKQAKLIINGGTRELFQKDRIYEKNINSHIEEGANAIKIEPKTVLDILKLEVKFE